MITNSGICVEKCMNCRFWRPQYGEAHRHEHGNGQCHLHGPVVHMTIQLTGTVYNLAQAQPAGLDVGKGDFLTCRTQDVHIRREDARYDGMGTGIRKG